MSVISERYWPVPLARAIVAIVVAIVVAFTSNHSTAFAFAVFGGFALASALIVGVFGAVRIVDVPAKRLAQGIGAVDLIASLLAFVFIGSAVSVFLILVIAWAAVTAFTELYAGLRVRGRSVISRDWVGAGVVTAVFALALLLVPADYSLTYEVPVKGGDPLTLVLDAPVIAVGLFGAYAALLGVFLVIAAVSLRRPVEAAASGATI